MPRSTTIFRSNSAASFKAASSSARLCAFEIPTDDPRLAGFTKIGNGRVRATASASISSAPSPCIRLPAARSRQMRFIASLSIDSDDASTLAPTYGRSASSNRPCTVPSSPNVPCSTGNTTSISGCAPGSGRIGWDSSVRPFRSDTAPLHTAPDSARRSPLRPTPARFRARRCGPHKRRQHASSCS